MAKELWILRHGKAERYDGNEDYERRLKKRGKRDSQRLGKWLKAQALLPDTVISSPATRAIMTAKIICDTLGIPTTQIRLEKRLYDEGLVRVKSVLSECSNNCHRVLVVGHNPELESLLNFLVDPLDIPTVEKLLPTAAFARLLMPEDWTHLEKDCAKLISITSPKSLKLSHDEPSDELPMILMRSR